MNDQNSRHGAGETALSGQSPATTESGKRLIGESAPSWPPKPRESITTRRHSNSQTLVGKAGTQRIKRSPVKTALYMVGVLMMLFSATMLPPMAMAWWYDGYALVVPFAQTMAATLGLGNGFANHGDPGAEVRQRLCGFLADAGVGARDHGQFSVHIL